MAVEAIARL